MAKTKPSKHYSIADLLWGTTAYCDQWEKTMAIYDDNDKLRAVIKDHGYDTVSVLMIGDDKTELYLINRGGFELGSTGKNKNACFKLFLLLRDSIGMPTFIPPCCKKREIPLYQIFIHTRAEVIARRRWFRATDDDCSDKIAPANEVYYKYIATH